MSKSLNIVLSVDWEGLSLEKRDLQALANFKKRWVNPFVHYMNPAYLTDNKLKKYAVQQAVASVVDGGDEWGLHLHAPKHFVQASGVQPRTAPSFSALGDSYSGEGHGQEVMLLAYSSEEFEKMLVYSKQLFAEQGWPQPKSFRAGGWMLDPEFFESLKKHEFVFDSSATPASSVEGSCWQGESLHRYLSLLWGDFNKGSQPQQVLPDFYEVPNNFGAIDYWQGLEVLLQQSLQLSDQQGLAVITIHQETAAEYLPRLEEFLQHLQLLGLQLRFTTNECWFRSNTSLH